MANEFVVKNGLIVNSGGISTTGDLAITGSLNVSENIVVQGTITAQEFNTEFVSSSIIFSSGSTKFGDSSDDTHDFTGSINVDGGISILNTADPKLTFTSLGSANQYSVGIDDSDSDKFKISRSSTLGTNDIYKYNYNGGSPNHTLSGDLILTNSNVGLAANTILKTNGSGFVVPAVAGTDYVATGSIKPKLGVNNVADFKALTAGYASLTAVTDVQVNDDSPYTFWMAPNDGYIEKVVVIVGGANGTTDNFTIQPYKNASTMGSSVANNIGAKGNVDTFTFGSSYNFVAEDKIQLYVDRSSNTSALYTINVFFTLT